MNLQYPIISEAMKLYLETKAAAEDTLENVEFRALVGAESRRNAAKQELPAIARKIRELVLLDGAAIFPLGPTENQEAFSTLAEDEGDAITVSASELYEDLARSVEPYLGPNRTFTVDTSRALIAALTNKARQLDLLSFNMSPMHTMFGQSVGKTEELTQSIKNLVREANGDEFNVLYITQQVVNKVLATAYDRNVVTVVVLNAEPDEAKGDLASRLFGGHTVTLDVTNAPDKNDLVVLSKKLKPFYARAAGVVNSMKSKPAAKKPVQEVTPETNEGESL